MGVSVIFGVDKYSKRQRLGEKYTQRWKWIVSSSVTQLCATLQSHGLQHTRLHHQPPELAQTHILWVGDATNHLILCHPLVLLPSIFPGIRVFLNDSVLCIGGQSIGASASALVLPMNIQDWFPLEWTGLISLQSKGLSRVFPNTTVQKHQFFIVSTLS